mmetsp:Transcript_18203/g.37621  ORF Transcript_18203/g.37621 Transcript_18203/m.37621 type:complete len:302 (-) Transcript_18203:34-939(-)
MFFQAQHYAKQAEKIAAKEGEDARRRSRRSLKASKGSEGSEDHDATQQSLDTGDDDFVREALTRPSMSERGTTGTPMSPRPHRPHRSEVDFRHSVPREAPGSTRPYRSDANLRGSKPESPKKKLEKLERRTASLVKPLEEQMALHTEREEKLTAEIKSHVSLAKARLDGANSKGTVISMRKVVKLQAERDRVVLALDYLDSVESEVKRHLEGAKLKVQLMENTDDAADESEHSSSGSSGSNRIPSSVPWECQDFQKKVDKILAGDEASNPVATPSDEELCKLCEDLHSKLCMDKLPRAPEL